MKGTITTILETATIIKIAFKVLQGIFLGVVIPLAIAVSLCVMVMVSVGVGATVLMLLYSLFKQ